MRDPRTVEEMWLDLSLRRQKAKTAIADHQQWYGDLPMVFLELQFEYEQRPWRGAVVHPSAYQPGWQVTYFDANGFSLHYVEKDLTEAVREVGWGMHLVNPQFLEEVAASQEFQDGVAWSMLPQEERWKQRGGV